MDPSMQGWGIPLAIVAVIWGINLNMRGSATRTIDGLLVMAMFGLCVAGAIISGWMAGILALFGASLAGGMVRQLSPLGPNSPARRFREQQALREALERQKQDA